MQLSVFRENTGNGQGIFLFLVRAWQEKLGLSATMSEAAFGASLQCWHPTWALIQVLVAALPIQFSANDLGKQWHGPGA